MFLTLESIFELLGYFGLEIDSVYLSNFELVIIFLLSNILFLIVLIFGFGLIWKVLSRIINSLF